MILFMILSVLVALCSGYIFNLLVDNGELPENPYKYEEDTECTLSKGLTEFLKNISFTPIGIIKIISNGLKAGVIVIKWSAIGVIIVAIIRTFVSDSSYGAFFGPTAFGMIATLIIATLMEVCSEGMLPIATDLLTKGRAPGNSFMFLMAGVSTDYTEIMILKDTTKSWKIALFLPLVTVPQIIIISMLLNKIPV